MSLYLDNAATTKIHKDVVDAMIKSLDYFGNSEAKYYDVAEIAKVNISNTRKTISTLLSCEPDNVIFTSGATEANNLIIKGLADYNKNKKRIIISSIEHSSIEETCRYLESTGYEIIRIGVDNTGLINLAELNDAINDNTLLVSIIWVNNEIGTIQKMQEIDKICCNKGVFLHSDATQAIGKIDINLNEYKALKSITFSAHKIYGPKGIGSLIIKKDENNVKIPLTPLLHGGEQEYGYRAGTLSNELIVGFGKSCELLMNETHNSNRILKELEDELILRLKNKFGNIMIINNPWEHRVYGIINVQFVGFNNAILLKNVKDIFAASTGSSCSVSKPSRVLKEIGLNDKAISYSIRLSLSKYTNLEELDILESL